MIILRMWAEGRELPPATTAAAMVRPWRLRMMMAAARATQMVLETSAAAERTGTTSEPRRWTTTAKGPTPPDSGQGLRRAASDPLVNV